MKPIITLLASLVVLAVIAANPWRMINETPDPDAGPLWFSGDFTPHSSFTEEGDTEDAVTLKTNQASQNQSCVRPAFREDLIPGLPSEITSRYPSRAATLTGPQRTSAATEVILTKDNRKADVRGSNGFVRCKITSTPFTNVVTGDNHTGCSTCDGIAKNNWLIYHPWHEGGLPYVPATERWTITTVGVRQTATIPGWPSELVKEEITSCTTNREVLKTGWVKVGPDKVQGTNEGGGAFGEAAITNAIPESITNGFYITPKTRNARFVYPHTNDLGEMRGITWQYDGNRKRNKDIEELKRNTEAESKRIMEKTGESIMFVRGDGRVPFDFKTDARDIELGYKPDGTVTWRKTPERNKP